MKRIGVLVAVLAALTIGYSVATAVAAVSRVDQVWTCIGPNGVASGFTAYERDCGPSGQAFPIDRGKAVVTTPTTAASTTTTQAPTTTGAPTTTTTTTVPSTRGYVLPGTVGYLGPALPTYNVQPAGTKVTIGGHVWTWQAYGLRNDDPTVVLDHVRINGSVYWNGSLTLTITNSIVDNTDQPTSAAVSGHSTGAIIASDSTFTGKAPSGWNVAAVWPVSFNIKLNRVALSGFPQGADPTSPGSYVKNSWIRTAVNGNAHLDGIFNQGDNDIEISGNYIDGSATNGNPTVTGGIFLQNRGVAGPTLTGISIHDNFIDMYGYPGPNLAVRNQSGKAVSFVNNTLGNGQNVTSEEQPGLGPAGTWGTCAGNVHVDGSPVPCA